MLAGFALISTPLPLAAADAPKAASSSSAMPTIDGFTRAMERQDGLLPLYWDADTGSIYLEVPKLGEDYLFFTTLTAGLGSNDVGLDRGQVSDAKRVHFERVGTRLLLVQPNTAYRASSDNPEEQTAVEQSFARSVLFGFSIVARSGERLLVNATPFVLRDGHGAADNLKTTKQGSYKIDPNRSVVLRKFTRAFPRNTEMEALINLEGSEPGKFVKDVTPTPEAISLQERYSFVAAPPPGFQPREHLPGDGYFGIDYADYAAPLGQPLMKHYIARHRLQKQDPSATVSDAVQPIVYYLDRGAPEPIRSALLEGARWWAQAFEAAGYRNAFRVELLPEGADPMDARYNVIQWVHRATRGWSYGAAIIDPDTGEIIKGNVTLGSLRARYDYLLAEGLLSPYADASSNGEAMRRFALARLSQLAAHELGHTLGLAHNYIASTEQRASVMDYPVPLVTIDPNGEIDLTQAYAMGIGSWDKVAIAYGYQDFSAGTDEPKALRKTLADARESGITFMTDQDARPAGAPQPDVNLWDNGRDVADELRHLMAVRAVALSRLGERSIPEGMPQATIEEVLVPMYLLHRYQIEATAKALGGLRYTYTLRGDGQAPPQTVPAAEQRKALAALLEALDPQALALPRNLLAQIPPRPPTYPSHRELFARTTGLSFDPLSPASTASRLVLDQMLQPERAARLLLQQALDPQQPGLADIIDALSARFFDAKAKDGYAEQILFAQQTLLVQELTALSAEAALPQVRAVANYKLEAIRARATKSSGSEAQRSQQRYLADTITRFQQRTADNTATSLLPAAPTPPPGSPLGD